MRNRIYYGMINWSTQKAESPIDLPLMAGLPNKRIYRIWRGCSPSYRLTVITSNWYLVPTSGLANIYLVMVIARVFTKPIDLFRL
jgi:hypothetical protein